ncbi:MAG TPA: nitrate- and nitrite sensing domain-containing protein [Trebonia sp.]
MVGNDSRSLVPALAASGAPPRSAPSNVVRPGRTPNRWHLRNWRMRWRVLALVLVPTVAALVLGTLRVQASSDTAATASRTAQLGAAGSDITALAESVEDERDLTAGYVAAHQTGQTALAATIFRQLQHQYGVTTTRTAAVKGLAAQINASYPAAAQADLTSALTSLSALTELRQLAHSQITTLPMINHYTSVVAALLAFDNDIAAGSPSAPLAQTVTSIEALAQVEEETSQQRAVLYAALIEGKFEPGALTALIGAQSSQASALASFQKVADNLPSYTPQTGLNPFVSESQQFNDIVTGADVDAALAIELDATVAGRPGQSLTAGMQGTGGSQAWYSDMAFTLGQQRSVLGDNLTSATVQANALRQGAQSSERLTEIAVLVLLLLVLMITIVMARSMILPLRRLRADALDVAGRRLPEMVRRLSEADPEEDQSVQVEPIDIDSTDEIGEVARAFDRVHSEAARLAGDEAMLRANLNAMFVNLSRRSQTLIERQLGIIESLEQTEQEASRLSSLFRLDHLATRMRRNSENLLVLAGHEAPRKWTQPVALVDVLRAAVSEIEQYDRITLNVQSGLVIAGRAASDVVHLVAELVENATTFSRKGTQVFVTGQLLVSGGVLIEITDEGLGIPEHELAYANWRLDNPPVIDVAVSRRMGLFVVGRLAARHGIKVRLRRAQSGGLSALIWVPETVAETEPASPVGSRRRFGSTGGQQVVISSPAQAVAAARTPVMGVKTAAARPKSIWFDTGDEDQNPAQTPVREPDPPAPAPVEPQPAEQGTAAMVAVDGTGARLPIFDSIESEWFRRGDTSFDGGSADGSWTSPADEGFRRAAETLVAPVAGQATIAGLPKRVPSANLVPGSIAARPAGGPRGGQAPAPAQADGPSRSPEAVRARLTGFQMRGREGRTGAPQWSGTERRGTDEN